MKILLPILLLFSQAFATNYTLVDGQSFTYVNGLPLLSGDSVFFQAAKVYSGNLRCKAGVVYVNKSVFMPVFTSTGGVIVTMASGATVEGFKITDLSMPVDDHTAQAKIGYAITISGNNNMVKSCDFSLVGVAIEVKGSFNTITKSKFSNQRMVRNTPTSVNADDDYGANPLVIGGNDNTISYNEFKDCWATSFDYGLDGGAVEFYGLGSRNKVTYNTAINCVGFAEFGSNVLGTSADNLISHNLLINNGLLTWVNGSGQFALSVTNLQYVNNFIIETNNWTGKAYLYDFSGVQTNMLALKNNIFYLATGIDVVKYGKFTSSILSKSGNIYVLYNGSVTNLTADASELITTQQLFKSMSGDPESWDYTLTAFATGRGIQNITGTVTPPVVPPVIPPVVDTPKPPVPPVVYPPTVTISGSTSVCIYSTKTYKISPAPNVTYLWTVPYGARIMSQTTGSITLYFRSYFRGGTLKVLPIIDGLKGAETSFYIKKKRC